MDLSITIYRGFILCFCALSIGGCQSSVGRTCHVGRPLLPGIPSVGTIECPHSPMIYNVRQVSEGPLDIVFPRTRRRLVSVVTASTESQKIAVAHIRRRRSRFVLAFRTHQNDGELSSVVQLDSGVGRHPEHQVAHDDGQRFAVLWQHALSASEIELRLALIEGDEMRWESTVLVSDSPELDHSIAAHETGWFICYSKDGELFTLIVDREGNASEPRALGPGLGPILAKGPSGYGLSSENDERVEFVTLDAGGIQLRNPITLGNRDRITATKGIAWHNGLWWVVADSEPPESERVEATEEPSGYSIWGISSDTVVFSLLSAFQYEENLGESEEYRPEQGIEDIQVGSIVLSVLSQDYDCSCLPRHVRQEQILGYNPSDILRYLSLDGDSLLLISPDGQGGYDPIALQNSSSETELIRQGANGENLYRVRFPPSSTVFPQTLGVVHCEVHVVVDRDDSLWLYRFDGLSGAEIAATPIGIPDRQNDTAPSLCVEYQEDRMILGVMNLDANGGWFGGELGIHEVNFDGLSSLRNEIPGQWFTCQLATTSSGLIVATTRHEDSSSSFGFILSLHVHHVGEDGLSGDESLTYVGEHQVHQSDGDVQYTPVHDTKMVVADDQVFLVFRETFPWFGEYHFWVLSGRGTPLEEPRYLTDIPNVVEYSLTVDEGQPWMSWITATGLGEARICRETPIRNRPVWQ